MVNAAHNQILCDFYGAFFDKSLWLGHVLEGEVVNTRERRVLNATYLVGMEFAIVVVVWDELVGHEWRWEERHDL